jgi:large subunit ribosomal protein L3
MSGRKLKKRCTINSLKLISMDKERNLLNIKGSIPGKVGSLVEIVTM